MRFAAVINIAARVLTMFLFFPAFEYALADEKSWKEHGCPEFTCSSLSAGSLYLFRGKDEDDIRFLPKKELVSASTSLRGPICFVYVPKDHSSIGGAIMIKRIVWTGVRQRDGSTKAFFRRNRSIESGIKNTEYERYHSSLSLKPFSLYQNFHSAYNIDNRRRERSDNTIEQREKFNFPKEHQNDDINLEKVTLITYSSSSNRNTCLDFVLNTNQKNIQTWRMIELMVNDIGPSDIIDDDKRQFTIRLSHK